MLQHMEDARLHALSVILPLKYKQTFKKKSDKTSTDITGCQLFNNHIKQCWARLTKQGNSNQTSLYIENLESP